MASATAPPTQQNRDSLVGKAWDAQERLEGRISNIGKGRYGRVLRMARRPTPEEFRKTSTIAAIGLLLLGSIAFLIFYVMRFIPQ